MKKIIFLLSFSIVYSGYAQQDTVWRRGGLVALNFTQVSLSNWAAGGENSIAGNSIINYFANLKKGKNAWDNNFDFGYGMQMQGLKGKLIKSDDKIDITSKFGRQASKHWFYSTLINFRSQFSPGYNTPNDSFAISNFLAPAYVITALGMDYKPNDYFSLFLSPITGRYTIVNNKALSDAGAFGVDTGKIVRKEFGSYLKATLKKTINSNFTIQTSFDLFSNYNNKPQNIDVNWQMLLLFKISKYFSASLTTQLLYDDNTKIIFYKSGSLTIDHVGPGTQFKEVLGIGFTYKFSSVTRNKQNPDCD